MRGVPTKRSSGVAGGPPGGHTSLLPAGDFSAELGIAFGAVLRAVVALPGVCRILGAARAHAGRGTAAFIEHMHGVPCLQQGLCARQACANDGDGECVGGCAHGCGSVRSWGTQMKAWVSMPSACARAVSWSRAAGVSTLVRDKIQQ